MPQKSSKIFHSFIITYTLNVQNDGFFKYNSPISSDNYLERSKEFFIRPDLIFPPANFILKVPRSF